MVELRISSNKIFLFSNETPQVVPLFLVQKENWTPLYKQLTDTLWWLWTFHSDINKRMEKDQSEKEDVVESFKSSKRSKAA